MFLGALQPWGSAFTGPSKSVSVNRFAVRTIREYINPGGWICESQIFHFTLEYSEASSDNVYMKGQCIWIICSRLDY